MSLKARIEAVIYAAEEPVTLAQLASLFREEALASREAHRAAVEAIADQDAPGESGLPAMSAAGAIDESGEAAAPQNEGEAHSAERAVPAVPSESAAQNSSDAEVAVPDFAGEPQPFPNEPPEVTTPSRENDPGLLPGAQRPDHAAAPATNVAELIGAEREAPSPVAPSVVTPEDEKKAARALDREIRAEIRSIVDELIADYSAADSGLEIREVAGGFRFATRPEYHDAVRAFVKSLKPPMKLSLQALETLAVIAYKQPVTAPEIGEIRGVDSGGVLGSLVARKLITTAGRKQVIGRPILYKTTKEFLLRFGLKDLNELPSIEEFEKMASELAESEEATGETAEELPFAQNESPALEENAESMEDANEPPVTEPAEPQPPVSEPDTEPQPLTDPKPEPGPEPDPEPVPTSEQDAAGPGSGDPIPPPEEDGRAIVGEDQES